MLRSSRQDKCIEYLYNNGFSNKLLFEAVNAVRKVSGEIECAKNGEFWKSKFSDRLDKCLNESLMVMCCDPECDSRNIQFMRSLIEHYHEMHDMPEIEIHVPENQVVAPSLQREVGDFCVDSESEDDCDVEDEILRTTGIGEYISFGSLVEEMAECAEDETRILDALKELVRRGHLEVTERDPYNGTISMCIRVK